MSTTMFGGIMYLLGVVTGISGTFSTLALTGVIT